MGLFDVLFDHRILYGTDDDERSIRTMQLAVADGAKLELMEPTAATSPLADHLDRRGEGFHHMTLRVTDIAATGESLAAVGVRTVGTDYSNPAWMETYTHPATCHGVLLQIAQTNRNWLAPMAALTLDDVLDGNLVWTGSSVVWRDPSRRSEPWPPLA